MENRHTPMLKIGSVGLVSTDKQQSERFSGCLIPRNGFPISSTTYRMANEARGWKQPLLIPPPLFRTTQYVQPHQTFESVIRQVL